MIDKQTKPGEYIPPAFPTGIITDDKGVIVGGSNGMSLRDYFAAKAMEGVFPLCQTSESAAKECYKVADAMMKAREA